MSASPFYYFDAKRLTLNCGNNLPAAQSLLNWSAQHALLEQLASQPTATDLLVAAEQAYQAGYEKHASTEFELQGLAVAGIGDPLLHLDLLKHVLPAFKQQRHGVPVTLVTYGLIAADASAALCELLLQLEVEKLEIFLPANTPPSYANIVQPHQHSFTDVCQFIHTASDAGLHVSCFAFADAPQKSALRALAKELGARNFIFKT